MEKFDQFKLFLIRQGRSPGTVDKHVRNLRTIQEKVPDLAPGSIDSLFISFLQKGLSKGYLNVLIQALRAWGEFTKDERYKQIKYFTIEESHKATMSDKEIEDFLSLPPIKNNNPTRSSNKELFRTMTLFFKVLAFSGMRPGEVAMLRTETVDFGRMVFDLSKTKTNTPRLVPIAPMLINDLTEHIKLLKSDFLFTKEDSTPVNKSSWNHHFESRIKRLGIKRQDLSTHSLRHSFISRLLAEDVNIFKVQRIVGHKKIETTNIYTHLVTKDLTSALQKDPLGKQALSYDERFKQLREEVRRALENHAHTPEEEKKMLKDLLNLP